MAHQVQLMDELTIDMIETLFTNLKEALSSGQAISIDLQRVTRIDTAAAQLLAAVHKEAVKSGTPCTFQLSAAAAQHLQRIGITL